MSEPHPELRFDQDRAYDLGVDERTSLPATPWHFPGPEAWPALAAEERPPFVAPRWEKELHRALTAGDPEAILQVAARHPAHHATCEMLAGFLLAVDDPRRAAELLERVVVERYDPLHDPFLPRYLPTAGAAVPLAAGIVVELPLRRQLLALAAAELLQRLGELDRAAAVLRRVPATTHVRLSLAEILLDAGRPEDVVAATEGVFNDDDVTALVLVFRAIALARLGRRVEAATTAERAAAEDRRSPEVLRLADQVRKELGSSG